MSGHDEDIVEICVDDGGEDDQPPDGYGLITCSCPESDGKVYHQRSTCTDPLVKRLDWFAEVRP